MTFSDAGSILATLTQANGMGALARRVKDLPVPEFVCLLDFITAEFQQFLRAIELINNDALETMLEQLLDAFTLKLGQIIRADRTAIFLVDTEKKQLWSKITQAPNAKPLEIRIPVHIGIVGRVAETGELINIADAYTHPSFNKEIDEHPGYQTQSLLCIPIFSNKNPSEVVAVVQLLNKAGNVPFSSEDEDEFRNFASSIGIILESCQSFYVAARKQRGVSALLRATSSLGQSLDLDATLQSVMEQARDLMQADRSTLFLLSKESNELWTKVATTNSKNKVEIRITANKGIAGYVASTGQTLNITDAYQDPRFDPSTDQRTGYLTRTILCMPVYSSSGDLIGVTQLINKKNQGTFTSTDEAFMAAFNRQAGIALENAQLFKNVLIEKQYQKDILQSLSDAVISTDMQGRIVTINDAALELLGCPVKAEGGKHRLLWENKLIDRYIWEVVPIESLRWRLQDSLSKKSHHYLPEQNLIVGLYIVDHKGSSSQARKKESYILAVQDRIKPDFYIPWNELVFEAGGSQIATPIPQEKITQIERSINLTINPLTNPEGGVRGGLVVLEDISREKRLKNTMYRYLTPGVAERVMELGEDSLMVGERKEVTILFSDIRGYTTLTENLGASEVVSLLNQYFETMVEAVFDHDGTLDKFIGDALMAVFGAPLPLADHAWKAVESSLDMRRRLAEFNRKRIVEAQPQIHVGIGISSGDVVSGNIGSQKRMDYTVIGDGVNLSSRLEGVTKEYGCDIILSEYTYELCADKIWVRELDKIRVKGKHQAVNIYELIGDRRQPLDGQKAKMLELYEAGRHAYLVRNFKKSLVYFNQIEEIDPTDRVVAVYLERCLNYLKNPPPETWDGVHTMTTK
ncbi:GAF domain-containing protein [Ancylothrix sp. C2]|uniref:adenylate/guanylate cyclase domain-containing protein n=1 Tax=Ancylothrix sp. D3o TaxID=2953691 RepID=UPI0021BBA742|nr:adenylate/guanylate cyclase domain-containing protein [Ancylothrix sp. D3o]MCT7948445.1 GAF domain-containing protein [Ancylothrix sp. D3o]